MVPSGRKKRAFYTGDGVYEVALYEGAITSPSRHSQDEFLKKLILAIK
jgi:hypothetical protein